MSPIPAPRNRSGDVRFVVAAKARRSDCTGREEAGTVINQRRKQLPKVHEQYQSVSARFEKRGEGINAAKPFDLARAPYVEATRTEVSQRELES